MVKATIKADVIPIIVTIEMEYNAGCLAKTKTPTPKIVVITDNITDVLYKGNAITPVFCCCSSPFVIKIL